MKNKKILLLFAFTLACLLNANAHKVTFKVTNAPFIVDKYLLNVQLDSQSGNEGFAQSAYYNPEQDAYIIDEVKDGPYRYTAYYEGDENNAGMLPYQETIPSLTGDMTVTIDLGHYHLATFSASDGYSLQNVTLQYGINMPEMNVRDNKIHLPDGTYMYDGIIIRNSDNTIFRDTKYKSFTIEGSDKNITYTVNPADFHRLAFNVIGYGGAPITDYYAHFYDEEDDNGRLISIDNRSAMMVRDGNYAYSLAVGNVNYPTQKGRFTVAGNDLTVKVSYEDYKKLALTVKGNVFAQLSEPRLELLDPSDPYDDYRSYTPVRINDTEYLFEIYSEPMVNIEEYKITSYSTFYDKEMFPYTGTIDLTEDRTMTLTLPEYYPIRFNVVDKQGNDENPVDYEILMPTKHLYDSRYITDHVLYMPSGSYTGRFYISNEVVAPDIPSMPGKRRKAITRGMDAGPDAIVYQDFTVGNEGKEVKVVYNSDLYFPVEVDLANVSQALQPYTDDLYILLYKDNLEYADEYVNGAGIYVPEGTYTYVVLNDTYSIVPLTGTVNVTGASKINLDLGNYGIVVAYCIDPDGNPINEFAAYLKDADNNITDIWQDVDEYNNEIVLFAPAGTYQTRVMTEKLQGEKSIRIVAGEIGQENINLTARQAGKFPVMFEIMDDTYEREDFRCSVELQGYGTVVVTNGIAYFDNVNAAQGLAYTVRASGYRTVTGTIDVNDITSVSILMQVEDPNSLETIKVGNNIKVYPTVADDYISICADNQDETAWTIRMISATGATVYMEKQVISGEKQINVGNLPKGFYVLMLNNGEQRLTYKILKK